MRRGNVITEEQMQYKRIVAIVAAAMLLLAIPSIWPYGYYQILRWVIAGAAVFIGYLAYQFGKKWWLGVMVAIAIVFNPIAPIYFSKEVWVVFDFIVAVVFLASLRFVEPPSRPNPS